MMPLLDLIKGSSKAMTPTKSDKNMMLIPALPSQMEGYVWVQSGGMINKQWKPVFVQVKAYLLIILKIDRKSGATVSGTDRVVNLIGATATLRPDRKSKPDHECVCLETRAQVGLGGTPAKKAAKLYFGFPEERAKQWVALFTAMSDHSPAPKLRDFKVFLVSSQDRKLFALKVMRKEVSKACFEKQRSASILSLEKQRSNSSSAVVEPAESLLTPKFSSTEPVPKSNLPGKLVLTPSRQGSGATQSPHRSGSPPVTVNAAHGPACQLMQGLKLQSSEPIQNPNRPSPRQPPIENPNRRGSDAARTPYRIEPDAKLAVLTKNLIQERAALQSFDHPNIITLRYAFQDAAFWYLAMDYFPNGEVFTLLKKQPARRFSVAVVQTWAAMLLSALEHMHDKGFIHRDIKLENILMSRRNHAILMDFGLSVHLPTELAAGCTDLGFCGTPEYLAPEVIRSGLYGYEVDMWGLGIVIYELLVGYPPYFMTGRMTKDDLFRRIVCDPVPPSERLPSLAQDLVRRLLHKSPEKRLTADEMRQHPFFEGVDWDMVDRGTCPCIVLPTDASPLSPSPACVRQGATARSAQEPDSSDLQAHSGSESSEGEDSLKSLESAGSPSSFPSSPSSSNSGNLVGVLDFGVGDPLDPLDPLDPADGSQRSPSCLGSPGLVEMGTGQSSSSSSSSSSSMSTSILGPSRSRSHGCVRVINGGMKGYGDGGDGGSGEGGSGEGEGHGDGVGVGTLEAGKWGIQGRLTCSSTGVVVLHPQPSDALLSAISRQLPTPKARFKGSSLFGFDLDASTEEDASNSPEHMKVLQSFSSLPGSQPTSPPMPLICTPAGTELPGPTRRPPLHQKTWGHKHAHPPLSTAVTSLKSRQENRQGPQHSAVPGSPLVLSPADTSPTAVSFNPEKFTFLRDSSLNEISADGHLDDDKIDLDSAAANLRGFSFRESFDAADALLYDRSSRRSDLS